MNELIAELNNRNIAVVFSPSVEDNPDYPHTVEVFNVNTPWNRTHVLGTLGETPEDALYDLIASQLSLRLEQEATGD